MQFITDHGSPLDNATICRGQSFSCAIFCQSRRQAPSERPEPTVPRKLPFEQRKAALEVLHSSRFVDVALAEVHATLLAEGRYFCSVRSMQWILEENYGVRGRCNQLWNPSYAASVLLAKGPNELWS